MPRDYEIDVLRVEADGSVTIVQLVLVGDADTSFGGSEPGTVWRLDGVDVVGTPTLLLCDAQVETTLGPQSLQGSGLHFEVNGVSYVAPRGLDPATVTSISDIVLGGTIQTNFIGSTGTLLGADVRQAPGLVVTENFSGVITSIEARTFQRLDDDKTINLAPGTEVGQAPILLPGDTGSPIDASTSLSGTFSRMVLVEVQCTLDGGGAASFQALLNYLNVISYGLVPLAGSVDVDAIASIVSITELPNTLDGMEWSDFGFALSRQTTRFGANDDISYGEIFSERLFGRAGDDTLFGAHGEDLLDGGVGSDALYGGLNADLLMGRGGADTLHGGFSGDTLIGGIGNDVLDGSHGRDSLAGDGGRDTLIDGRDRDTLTGGAGADVFVLHDDNRLDVVTDFENGVDLLDLGVGFGALTITDVAPGEVLIRYRGDSLTLQDTAGLLTAADITAADLV